MEANTYPETTDFRRKTNCVQILIKERSLPTVEPNEISNSITEVAPSSGKVAERIESQSQC